MKVLFVISCIVLYWIIGRLYVEIVAFPMLGNPKDYDDLYRGFMAAYRIIYGKTKSKDAEDLDKVWGIKWKKVVVEIVASICSLALIYYMWCYMKRILIQLLLWLRG